MTELETLVQRWLEEAETLDAYQDSRGAAICRKHAAELREAVERHQREILTVAEAATESGYSEDYLRHLLADGTIPNAGRKGSPRIRRADLPIKNASTSSTGFDPDEAAKELAGLLGEAA